MKPVDHVARFIAEVRAEPVLSPMADEMERALHAVDCEGDTNPHAAAFFSALEWILKQPRTIREKLDVICKLTSMKGNSFPACKNLAVGIKRRTDMADWDHTGTGSVAHNNAVQLAHCVRAAAYRAAGSNNPAAIKAADVVWARSVLASAKSNGVFAPNVSEMLWELTGQYT